MVLSRASQRTVAVAVVTSAMGAALLQCWLLFSPLSVGGDFLPLRHAARALLAGRSVYSDRGFVYPPSAAMVLTPLAHGSRSAAWTVWLVVCLVGLAVSALVIVRVAVDRRMLMVGATVMLFFGGCLAGDSLWIGNMSVALVPLAVTAVAAFDRQQWAQGSWLLCLSLLLKPLLVPLLAVPWLRGRWRDCVLPVSVVAGLLLASCALVPGGASLLQTLTYCLRATNLHGSNAVNNVSLHGWAEAHHTPAVLADVAALLVVGGVVSVLVRSRRRRPVAADAGTVFAAVLLAGPICEPHYLFTVGGIGLLVLATSSTQRRDAMVMGPGLFMLMLPTAARDALLPSTLDHQSWYVVAQLLLLAGFCCVRLPARVRRPARHAAQPIMVAAG